MSPTKETSGFLISPRSALRSRRGRNPEVTQLLRQMDTMKKDYQDRMFQLEAQHALAIQKLKAQIKQENDSKQNNNDAAVLQVPQALIDAIDAARPHVAKTKAAAEAMDALDQQIANLKVAVQLEPILTLYTPIEDIMTNGDPPVEEDETVELLPVSSVVPAGVQMMCATYPANDPSEDRYTVVLGRNFCFAGVWDGHAGTTASEFTSRHIFTNFQQAVLSGASIPEAFEFAYRKTDIDYLQYARELKNPAALFSGTCAIACYVDFASGLVTCGNCGDSRAVMGVFENDELKVVPLSVDHTSENRLEQERMLREHPDDPQLIVDMAPQDGGSPDWRVKGVASFTRSLGDTHLKDKASAAVYNSYMPADMRIHPRPGVKAHAAAENKTLPYLSNIPDIQEATVENGFIIIACDGVWDEMTSQQAVNTCYDIIRDNAHNKDADIAELFVQETLRQAAERISVTYDEEQDMTLEELMSRPQGKRHWSHRSHLHDDITVVILQFDESGSAAAYKSVRRSSTDSLDSAAELGMLGKKLKKEEFSALLVKLGKPLQGKDLDAAFAEIDSDGEGTINMFDFDAWWMVQGAKISTSKQRRRAICDAIASGEVEKQKGDKTRQATDEQILQMVDVFGGMNSQQLKILYNALDTDASGTLERDEVERLLCQVLQIDVTPLLVETAFAEMDDDHSGVIEFNEFCTFFGIEM